VILVESCANCGKSLSASFSRSFSITAYFLAELSICRHCGADFRYQAQPSPDFTYHGSPLERHVTLEPYVAVEEIFQRSSIVAGSLSLTQCGF
jgi:predicted amidophosphoribosyltransferase